MKPRRKIPDDFLEYGEKCSITQLCKRYKAKRQTIQKWRIEKGIKGTKKKYTRPRKVAQYSKGGLFIRAYENANVAARITHGNAIYIRACCSGAGKTSGGYVWKYLEIETDTD